MEASTEKQSTEPLSHQWVKEEFRSERAAAASARGDPRRYHKEHLSHQIGYWPRPPYQPRPSVPLLSRDTKSGVAREPRKSARKPCRRVATEFAGPCRAKQQDVKSGCWFKQPAVGRQPAETRDFGAATPCHGFGFHAPLTRSQSCGARASVR